MKLINIDGVNIKDSQIPASAGSSLVLVKAYTGTNIVSILGDTFETPWANVVTGASNTWTEVDAA